MNSKEKASFSGFKNTEYTKKQRKDYSFVLSFMVSIHINIGISFLALFSARCLGPFSLSL